MNAIPRFSMLPRDRKTGIKDNVNRNGMKCSMGFASGRSCQANLMPLYGKVTYFQDKGNAGILICLDMTPYKKLLVKQEKIAVIARTIKH